MGSWEGGRRVFSTVKSRSLLPACHMASHRSRHLYALVPEPRVAYHQTPNSHTSAPPAAHLAHHLAHHCHDQPRCDRPDSWTTIESHPPRSHLVSLSQV